MLWWTVAAGDVLIYIPAVVVFVTLYYRSERKITKVRITTLQNWLWCIDADIHLQYEALFLVLVQPPLLLIDHGHFQYNSISLGFTLWAINFILMDKDSIARWAVVDCLKLCHLYQFKYISIFFCLSLNYKQMSLYHSPAFFFFLLGKNLVKGREGVWNIVKLGVTVILTFTSCWVWFCIFNEEVSR